MPDKFSQIVASPHFGDFIAFLRQMADQVSDVRIKIEPADSLEIRQAINHYLSSTVDNLKQKRKNMGVELHRPDLTLDE